VSELVSHVQGDAHARQTSGLTARRLRVEGDLIYLRWILLAAGALMLVFSGNVQRPLWGWLAILGGVGANGLFLWRMARGSFPLAWSIVAQGVDIALLQGFTAALRGGATPYLAWYTTVLIVATMRFGVWGAVGSAVVGGLLGLRAVLPAMPHALASLESAAGTPIGTPTGIVGAILADAGLLAYFAYLLRAQYLAYRQSEDQLRKRISEFAVLHEVSSAVHDLRSEDALQNIVEIVTKVLSFRRAALFLAGGVMEGISHEYHSCRPSELGDRPAIRLDPQLLQEIMQRSDPVTIDGSQGTHEAEHGPVLQIAVPLHGAEGPIGVLVADGSDRQDSWRWDTGMLSSLAHSAVVAIENADLHHRIKRMANRDGLTDLYNHRYFQEHLREMIGASAGCWPVSLLMVEIDRFKRYNDTFGHRQGDMALQCLARALEQCTLPWEALVARYGGDEFVVVLPRVDRGELTRLARPLREEVYNVLTTSLAKQALPPMTLSIGMATYPLDAQAAGALIEAADRAMYVVKHDGGNWIHAYSQSVGAAQGGDAELTGAGTSDRRYS